ncbi:alpha-L-fucosidase [Fischerella thermalis CCMEE 5201]|nr:alpha-L-fucosidase [Fischerella thermalis CCMEE 5201]
MINWKNLLDLFLQSNCPLCQRFTSQELCPNCIRQLQKCHNLNTRSLPIFAWGTYGGILKRAIATMKYENHPEIARLLGQLLAQAWLSHHGCGCDRTLVVVPIPLHAHKLKQRGYNQAALIAQSFCEVTGLQLKKHGLERIKATQAQFDLSASEREKNLNEAFGLGKDFCLRPKTPVLLLDDIYTTGATARSAIQTLRESGISVYGLVAVAITVKSVNSEHLSP